MHFHNGGCLNCGQERFETDQERKDGRHKRDERCINLYFEGVDNPVNAAVCRECSKKELDTKKLTSNLKESHVLLLAERFAKAFLKSVEELSFYNGREIKSYSSENERTSAQHEEKSENSVTN
ncbi:MAG: hypothetical protein AB7P94_17420 [Steroidobacteraceae bacterium]